jgi:alkylation response protein AidB-like acyl-CoA dehydrogenase
VRVVVDEHVAPGADACDRDARISPHALDVAAREGWWGAALPVDVGGTGRDWVDVSALHEEVGRGCSSLRSLLTVHTMVGHAIDRWGTDAQREQWLAQLATGATLGAFCLTEPEAGSDAAALSARAERVRHGYRLSATKCWITGGLTAGLLLIFARSPSGICAFLVPAESVGVTRTPVAGLLGTRASMLAEVVVDACEVPDTALLGPDGFALATVITGTLEVGRLSVASGSVGIVRACLQAASGHAARRSCAGGTLKDQQLVRRMLTDMVVDARAGRLLCERAARLKDTGDPETVMATWIAKYHAARAAARAAGDAVQIYGARGCVTGASVDRYYRDAKVMEIIEGSTELHQVTIADDADRQMSGCAP